MPVHYHDLGAYTGLKNDRGGEPGDINIGTASYDQTNDAGASQPHTHGLDGSTGDSSSLPPYYSLVLIMRVS